MKWNPGPTDCPVLTGLPSGLVRQAHRKELGIYAKILCTPLSAPGIPRRATWGDPDRAGPPDEVQFKGGAIRDAVLVSIEELSGGRNA
jgi:hypothetical protein